MLKDDFGLVCSAHNQDAVDCYNHFAKQIISFGTEGDQVLEAAKLYDDNMMLQCCAVMFWLFSQSETMINSNAMAFMKQAEKLHDFSNNREKLYYEVINYWYQNLYLNAIEKCEILLQDFPEDLFIAYITQFLYFCHGQYRNGKRFKNMVDRISDHHESIPEFLALKSFAYSLSEDYVLAEKYAQQGMEKNPYLPWAQHTLAHVYTMSGETKKGIQAIAPYAKTWKNFCRPIHSHNAWHLALFRIDENQIDSALGLFDHQIWNVMPELVAEQLDSIALLWRLELFGCDVKAKWQSLKPYVIANVNDTIIPFISAHYIYALNRMGAYEDALFLLENTNRFANKQLGDMYQVWHETGLAVLQGIHAYTHGEYVKAVKLLEPIIKNQIYCIGGSDAQDDLFLQTYMSALIKANCYKQAEEFFKYLTRTRRQFNTIDNIWLSQIKSN